MSKVFRLCFKVPSDTYGQFLDQVLWQKIKKYPAEDLLEFIYKYLATINDLRITFKGLEENTLGEYDTFDRFDTIALSGNLRVCELPAVIVHELLHAVFPDVEDDRIIVKLERKVLRTLSQKKVDKLLHKVFKTAKWKFNGTFIRQVGDKGDQSNRNRTKARRGKH